MDCLVQHVMHAFIIISAGLKKSQRVIDSNGPQLSTFIYLLCIHTQESILYKEKLLPDKCGLALEQRERYNFILESLTNR